MNLSSLEEFFKNRTIPAWIIIIIYIPILFLVSQIISNTEQIPGVSIVIVSAYILIVSPYFNRIVFYVLFLLFNLTAIYVVVANYTDIGDRFVQLFTFDIFLIIAIEIYISMIQTKELIQNKLTEKTKLLEAIIFFTSRLGESRDFKLEIPSVIQKIGEAIGVSHVYIFENGTDERGLFMSQIFEWHGKDVVKKSDNQEFQHLYYDIGGFKRWRELLSDRKMISGLVSNLPDEERPLLEEQKIISILIVPIFVGSEFWGFIGLDECKRLRTWVKSTKEIIKTFADILGASFYTQKITKDLESHTNELEKTNKLMINRELRIIELKNQLTKLTRKSQDD